MSSVAISTRPFELGTTGWTADDLEDPEIEAQWAEGNYEIVEGVLTRVAPAYFNAGFSLFKLVTTAAGHIEKSGISGDFGLGVEIILEEWRVARADAALLTAEDKARQVRAVKALAKRDPDRTRILVPPTLIIESVSPGHELHDEQTKKRWYAEFGVPNYWLLHALRRSLHCYRLEGGEYLLDASGRDREEVRPSAFPRLVVPLAGLWMDW